MRGRQLNGASEQKATAMSEKRTGTTLYDKIWHSHLVDAQADGNCLLYIDRHLVHEVTSPQAFEGLRMTGRAVRAPHKTLALADHNIPTTDRSGGVEAIEDPESKLQIQTLEKNCAEFGIEYVAMDDIRQGIVHVTGPEQGFTLPGLTIVCGDSHTSTHGAFGALAHGIGTSEVEHVLATQTLDPGKSEKLPYQCGRRGTGPCDGERYCAGHYRRNRHGRRHRLCAGEYAGPAIEALSVEGRMTLCNMSIEAGARAGLIAPDDKTFAFLKGRAKAPQAGPIGMPPLRIGRH